MLESRGSRNTPAQAPVDRRASGLETPDVSRHPSPRFRGVVALAFLSACPASPAPAADAAPPPAIHRSAAERLALPRLQAVHEDVRRLEASHRSLPPLAGLRDYRTVLHAHAEDSAHTGGTRPEMLADSRRAGVQAIFLSDHYRPPRDFITSSWRGQHDGVLFVPGSEERGFLLYPMASIMDRMELPTPEFIRIVTAGEGLIFLSHVEEHPNHPVAGLTGMEIYNRHYDAERDPSSLLALALKLTDPRELAELQEGVRRYPDEVFAFQCEYPEVYLAAWDAGTQQRRLTGVAANDCHHNNILIVKMADENTVLLGTNVDKDDQMRKVTTALRPSLAALLRGHKPGDILARVDLDPYFRSFRNVSTHVLAPELTEPALRGALKAGHAYVAHDWMGDAAGFRFEALAADGSRAALMGDEVKLAPGLRLSAQFTLPCRVRLLRNGHELQSQRPTAAWESKLTDPGVYRVEGWLTLDGEERPWLYSNPIYVR